MMDLIYEKNRIFVNDEQGKLIAEITFPEVSTGVVDINHTFVDDSLRGQGIAGKLMKAAIEQIEKDEKQFFASCSYALHWLEKNPQYTDLFLG
jgi:predicted GNAT family acetyltransferase